MTKNGVVEYWSGSGKIHAGALVVLVLGMAIGFAIHDHFWQQARAVAINDPDWLLPLEAAKKYLSPELTERWQADKSDLSNLRAICGALQARLRDGDLIARGYLYDQNSFGNQPTIIQRDKWQALQIAGGPDCGAAQDILDKNNKFVFIDLSIKQNGD